MRGYCIYAKKASVKKLLRVGRMGVTYFSKWHIGGNSQSRLQETVLSSDDLDNFSSCYIRVKAKAKVAYN